MQTNLYDKLRSVINGARSQVYRQTNTILLQMYWEIGQLIVEDEQGGKQRADYGKNALKNLAFNLTREFGKGFDESNLRNMRQFFLAFPIRDALRHELSWTHYRILARIEDQKLRDGYITECINNSWNTRILQRNIDSNYLGRLLKTPENNPDSAEVKEFIKDPYIFEFLGIEHSGLTEAELETSLINHIQKFLMELGKGFAFVARQQHILTESSDFFIDLVFYNYLLKCFVIIDLKTGKLTHQDIEQMDMYVRLYNDRKKAKEDNPTIGIILCTDKEETIVKYSVLAENERLFASKYRLYLPAEEELKQLIEADRTIYELNKKES
ncbi:MAG: putative nuclease YhcG [Ignavibacteriaceae bacterium]|nr:putative nuclease YhcG [Ignavibacteriaceae bacterium]